MSPSAWTFASPAWLLVALALPAIAWLRARRGRPVLVVPFVSQWAGRELVPRSRLPLILVNAGIVLLAVALARPQHIDDKRPVTQDGYDIVLAIDLSGSMLAEDYERDGKRINRLQAIKPIVDAFIAQRPNDRIGLVTFAGRAYTLAPLTADHDWLHRQVERLKVGLIEDGTAIGDGLSLALSRLNQPNRETDGHRLGGFAILLTDGANNAGAVAPQEAAALAKAKGIPVYTIAAGAEGIVPMPVFDEQGHKLGYRNMASDVDEPTLRGIAAETGGRYFRATDSDTIDAAFAAIDRERTITFDATAARHADELYAWAAWPGLALIALAYTFAFVPLSLGGRRSVGAGLLPTTDSALPDTDSASSPVPTERRPPAFPSRVAA